MNMMEYFILVLVDISTQNGIHVVEESTKRGLPLQNQTKLETNPNKTPKSKTRSNKKKKFES